MYPSWNYREWLRGFCRMLLSREVDQLLRAGKPVNRLSMDELETLVGLTLEAKPPVPAGYRSRRS